MANNVDKNVLRRIKKCLALSESANQNEAATALRQAHALMKKYGITAEEAKDQDYVLDATKNNKKVARYTRTEQNLMNIVAQFFGCSFFTRAKWPVFVGYEHSTKIAQYASEVLIQSPIKALFGH